MRKHSRFSGTLAVVLGWVLLALALQQPMRAVAADAETQADLSRRSVNGQKI